MERGQPAPRLSSSPIFATSADISTELCRSEMFFEHVGVGFYDTFFPPVRQASCRRRGCRLARDRPHRTPSITNPGLPKYIFPGGYIPALFRGFTHDRALAPGRHRYRNPATALSETLKHGVNGSSRIARRFSSVRSALSAHVGILPGLLRDGIPRVRHDGVSNPDGQAQGVTPATRDYIGRKKPVARARIRLSYAVASRRRVVPSRRLVKAPRQGRSASCSGAVSSGKGRKDNSHCRSSRLTTEPRGCVRRWGRASAAVR